MYFKHHVLLSILIFQHVPFHLWYKDVHIYTSICFCHNLFWLFFIFLFCMFVSPAFVCVWRLKQAEADKQAAEETARKLGQIIADKDSKRWVLKNGFLGTNSKVKSDEFCEFRSMSYWKQAQATWIWVKRNGEKINIKKRNSLCAVYWYLPVDH